MDLKDHRFLTYFSDEEQETLRSIAEECHLPDEALIFEEGDVPDALYLILEGNVALWKRGIDASIRKIAVVETNEYFGELGVLDGGSRSARATAFGSVRVAKLPIEPLLSIMRKSTGASIIELVKQVIQRLRLTNELYITEAVRKERMMMVGEMANVIIHDFKNPFAVIQLACEGISRIHDDDQTQEFCGLIAEQVERVTNMAQDILDYSRTTTRLKKRPIHVADLFTQFDRLNRAILSRYNIDLDIVPADVTVEVDVDKVLRIIQNIVNNAVEVLPRTGQSRLAITARSSSGCVEIEIRDNGPGIPEEVQTRIFEPFVTQGKEKGSGLGMAIAYAFAQAHKGELSFKTITGEGTTFKLRLPSTEAA